MTRRRAVEVAGTRMVVCGSPVTKSHCRFCGAVAGALCDWPRTRRRAMAIDQVKAGMMIFRFESSEVADEVVYIAPQPSRGEVWLATRRGNQMFEHVITQPWKPVYVAAVGTCDAPCCFRHRRRVGPGVDYCRRHWRAWEKVA